MTPVLRYLDAEALRRALPMGAAIEAVENVMRAARDGDALAPARSHQAIPRAGREDCSFLVMPGTWAKRSAAVAKVVTNVPDNPADGRPTVQGVGMLFDTDTGSPRLIVDASTLTTIRTGAVIGLATRLLARRDARVVGLVGTGGLAADLVAGVAAVRDIERLLVSDLRPRAAAAFAAAADLPADVLDNAADVAAGADILITATSSLQPVVTAAAVRPGTHINAVGNFSPAGREIPGALVATAKRYVDDIDNAMAEAGELLLAAAEGLIAAGAAGLDGDLRGLVVGACAGRTDDDQITLFKTVGTALSDIAGLVAAADLADEQDIGVTLPGGATA